MKGKLYSKLQDFMIVFALYVLAPLIFLMLCFYILSLILQPVPPIFLIKGNPVWVNAELNELTDDIDIINILDSDIAEVTIADHRSYVNYDFINDDSFTFSLVDGSQYTAQITKSLNDEGQRFILLTRNNDGLVTTLLMTNIK